MPDSLSARDPGSDVFYEVLKLMWEQQGAALVLEITGVCSKCLARAVHSRRHSATRRTHAIRC